MLKIYVQSSWDERGHIEREQLVQVIEQTMAAKWEAEFDIEVNCPKFLREVVGRTEITEIIFENFDTEAAETQGRSS